MTKETTQATNKARLFYTVNDLYYDYYLPKHGENHKRYIPKDYWDKIWKSFSRVAEKRLIEKKDFTLPGRLGLVSIRKYKKKEGSKAKPVNWSEYRKTGKIVYYENDHTDGSILKCQWLDRPKFKTHFLFNFKLSRPIRKKLSKAMYEDHSMIERVDGLEKKIYRK